MTVTWKEPCQGSLEGVSLLLPVWKLHSRNPHVWIYTFALPEHTHDSHFTRDTGLPLVTFVQSAKRQAWGRKSLR